ncbi:MAG: sulfite exporter TauE/SafE family protein [Anaerolineae bacterium]|nr:sulfite exporter TauE/SafE family protein [Anaerolineae bacterium]
MLITVYIVIAVCAYLTGLSKGGLGGALGTLVTPLLALVVPASMAVGLTLPLLIVGDIFAVSAHWRGWDKRIVVGLLPGTILGVILGSLVISTLSPSVIQHVLGAAALVYVIYKFWARRQPATQGSTTAEPLWQSSSYGGMCGLTSTVANAGGPVMTVYMLTKRVTPSVFVATTALYFALLNVMKLPGYLSAHILTPEMIVLVAWSMPLIPMGVWLGKMLDKHIDMVTFETIILIFLGITGVALLLK